MISKRFRCLYWKTNKNTFFGFPPKSLLVVDYHSGGGFAGAAEMIILCPIGNIAHTEKEIPEEADFPDPSSSLEYRIGGLFWGNYAYKRNTQ